MRKNTRLSGYDYSQNGAYFITICTKNRAQILSTVVGGGVLDAPHALHNIPYVELTEHGKIAADVFTEMLAFYKNVFSPCFVVMPNHMHFILVIENNDEGASRTPPPTQHTSANATIPAFLSTFKRFTNKRIGSNIWQRSYYEHIIRDEQDFLLRMQYIENNPAKWVEDEYYVGLMEGNTD